MTPSAFARRMSNRKLSGEACTCSMATTETPSAKPSISRWLLPSKQITSSISASTLNNNSTNEEIEQRRSSEGGSKIKERCSRASENINNSLDKPYPEVTVSQFDKSPVYKPANRLSQFNLHVNPNYKNELRRRSASPSIVITSDMCNQTNHPS